MALAFDLADINMIPKKPLYVLRKTTGGGIEGPKAVFDLTLYGRPRYAVFPYIFHQMLKSHVIVDKPFVMDVFYLQFFSDTGTDKGEFICNSHLCPCVNCGTHKGTLHREELRKELRKISFNVRNEGRTGL